jgi:hypothetical protein
MEYARCERILSTVPRISAVPKSSNRDIQMSKVQKVPETKNNQDKPRSLPDEPTSSPNPRATVHHDRGPPGMSRPRVPQRHHHRVLFPPHPLQELQHRLGRPRDSVVRPGSELPVRHLPRFVRLQFVFDYVRHLDTTALTLLFTRETVVTV